MSLQNFQTTRELSVWQVKSLNTFQTLLMQMIFYYFVFKFPHVMWFKNKQLTFISFRVQIPIRLSNWMFLIFKIFSLRRWCFFSSYFVNELLDFIKSPSRAKIDNRDYARCLFFIKIVFILSFFLRALN